MAIPPIHTPDRPVDRWRRVPRPLRIGAVALLVVGGLQLTLQAALALPAAEAWLRGRVQESLAARVGTPVELGPRVDVDALYRVTFGPIDVADPAAGVARIRIDRVKVRPRWTALVAGRVEPATVRAYGVRVEVEPGRTGASRGSPPSPPPSPPARHALAASDDPGGKGEHSFLHLREWDLPLVHLRDVEVAVAWRDETIAFPAVNGRISGTLGARDVVEVALWRGRARAELTVRRDADGIAVDGRADRVPARRVPAEPFAGIATALGGELSAELRARAPLDLARADVTFRLEASRLTVEGEALGTAPIGPVDAALSGRFELDGVARTLRLEDAALELLGALRVTARGDARLDDPGIPIALTVKAENVGYRALADALPPALALPEDAPRPGGTFDLAVELGGPVLRPSEWTVAGGLDLSRLRAAARHEPPVALRRTFTLPPNPEYGRTRPLRVGPEDPRFVPVGELPAHVVRAVTTSEDAGFFGHEGFDLEELKNAFAAGAERGRVVRGGSTISQQLAKNLWLDGDKTLARKVREAILTIGLEATVPKSRLLEIYLNVAEWGPGLHGIGPAARHYFGVDARELNPKQAAFLASIIPNPVRYHSMYERGAMTDAWEQKVSELLLKLNDYGVLTDEALVAALVEPLVFARPEPVADRG